MAVLIYANDFEFVGPVFVGHALVVPRMLSGAAGVVLNTHSLKNVCMRMHDRITEYYVVLPAASLSQTALAPTVCLCLPLAPMSLRDNHVASLGTQRVSTTLLCD